MWNVGFFTDFGPPPNGITMSCFGSATGGADGCFDSVSLNTDIAASGHYSANTLSGVVITNTSGGPLEGFAVLYANYSAFNPGGPGVGIGIDDPLTQAARFSSSINGDAFGDFHDCAIGFQGYSGTIYSPTTCGVSSPDSSQTLFGVDLSLLGPNGSIQLPYTIDISADFVLAPVDGVPEPGASLLLLSGLAALTLRRKRLRL